MGKCMFPELLSSVFPASIFYYGILCTICVANPCFALPVKSLKYFFLTLTSYTNTLLSLRYESHAAFRNPLLPLPGSLLTPDQNGLLTLLPFIRSTSLSIPLRWQLPSLSCLSMSSDTKFLSCLLCICSHFTTGSLNFFVLDFKSISRIA